MADDLREKPWESDWRPLDEWLVLFCDAPARGFKRWLAPGFRHVRALSFDTLQDCWVMFDPATGFLVVRPVSRETVNRLLAWSHRSGGRVVKFAPRSRPIHWRAPGCAGAVAELLGLCALTPYGLYRRLRASGAQELARGSETETAEEGQDG